LSEVVGLGNGVDTINVTNGLSTFTLSGSYSMATNGSLVGAQINIASVAYHIASVTSGTTGTLTAVYTGTTNSAAAVNIPSGQGTGTWLLAYKASDGSCAVWNTYAGTIAATGSFASGTLDSGCYGMYLHDSRGYEDMVYTEVSGASTGVNCGYTSNFWKVGTLHDVACTGTVTGGSSLCAGHEAHGYHDGIFTNNPNFFKMAPENANSTTPFAPFGSNPPGGRAVNCEDHFSWNNATKGDTEPLVGSTANDNYSASSTGSSWTAPGQNENYILTQAGTMIRPGHNFILGPGNGVGCGSTDVGPFDYYFNAGQAIGAISQDGRLWVFSSSMLGQLGTDVDSHTREDDFVVKLQ
jgi:hypothetical protein